MTAAHLGTILNFAQVARKAKFKIESKCAAVKVTPLTEVAFYRQSTHGILSHIQKFMQMSECVT